MPARRRRENLLQAACSKIAGFAELLAKFEQKVNAAGKSQPTLTNYSLHLDKLAKENYTQVLPKSTKGKAMAYTMNKWELLSNYLLEGMLEIDNNLVENLMRPVALGRKNYLFAGYHKAAKRAGMVNSFFAMCKKENVNPQQWFD